LLVYFFLHRGRVWLLDFVCFSGVVEMITALKKIWIKWCLACVYQRDDELEKLYRHEKRRNSAEIRELFHKLESVESDMRRSTIQCGPL